MEQERKAILDDAEKQIEELTGGKTEYLPWIPQHAFPLGGAIVACGTEIERLGRALPLPSLKALTGLYVSLHRYAFELWRDRETVELLLKPVLGRKN